MNETISPRIAQAIAALPLRPDMRVLEIGCGPGVAARAISPILTGGRMVAIDRSAKAIALAKAGSAAELATGRLEFRLAAIEDFRLEPGEGPFDLVFAMRVGALDGRHREIESQALARIKAALKPDGMLFIDDRPPVRGRDI
jgi:cyclopropane fatty-acyl-phospholipid synthase-like methyltransferase